MNDEEERHLECLMLFDENNKLTAKFLMTFIKGSEDFKYSQYIQTINELTHKHYINKHIGYGGENTYTLTELGIQYKVKLLNEKDEQERKKLEEATDKELFRMAQKEAFKLNELNIRVGNSTLKTHAFQRRSTYFTVAIAACVLGISFLTFLQNCNNNTQEILLQRLLKIKQERDSIQHPLTLPSRQDSTPLKRDS